MDGIIDISSSLRRRTAKPNVWKQKQDEARKRTHSSFVSVFGGSSLQAKAKASQDAQERTPTASAQKADEGSARVRQEAQDATTDAQAANAAVGANKKRRKGGAK